MTHWMIKLVSLILITRNQLDSIISGLSTVAGCRRKSPPTWLVSAGYSAWHYFLYGCHFLIKYPWKVRLLWQISRLLQTFLTTLYLSLEQLGLGGECYPMFQQLGPAVLLSRKMPGHAAIICALTISINLVDHILKFCFCWILSKRSHHCT